MLKKPHFLWCERTAKISHLFQSCKSFFKNFASSEKFVFTSGFELLYCKLSVFVRTTVFLKRGCKGSDFFRTCKCFDVFFRKIFKNDLSIPCYLFIYNEKRSGCLRKGRRRHSAGVAKPATASEIAAAGDADELARNPRIPTPPCPKGSSCRFGERQAAVRSESHIDPGWKGCPTNRKHRDLPPATETRPGIRQTRVPTRTQDSNCGTLDGRHFACIAASVHFMPVSRKITSPFRTCENSGQQPYTELRAGIQDCVFGITHRYSQISDAFVRRGDFLLFLQRPNPERATFKPRYADGSVRFGPFRIRIRVKTTNG